MDRHVAPLGHIILILSGETVNTNLIVFGLTRSVLETFKCIDVTHNTNKFFLIENMLYLKVFLWTLFWWYPVWHALFKSISVDIILMVSSMTIICTFITKSFTTWGLSWLWSYGSWIHNYLCNRYLSPLKLWVRSLFMVMVYSIQHYVIKFVSDLRQVDGFLLVLRFPPPIKLTTTI